MRPKIIVKNFDKDGKPGEYWYVRVGEQWKIFDQSTWMNGGIEWINAQIAAVGRGSIARAGHQKARRRPVGHRPFAPPASSTSNDD